MRSSDLSAHEVAKKPKYTIAYRYRHWRDLSIGCSGHTDFQRKNWFDEDITIEYLDFLLGVVHPGKKVGLSMDMASAPSAHPTSSSSLEPSFRKWERPDLDSPQKTSECTLSALAGPCPCIFANVPDQTLMAIGRWRSLGFMVYIQQQISSFSMGYLSR